MKTTNKSAVRMLPVIRGLLAESSDNEDDPYSRVILRTAAVSSGDTAVGARPAFEVGSVDPDASDDSIREVIRKSVNAYTARHGVAPDRLVLQGRAAFQVEKQQITDQYPLRNKVALVTGAAGAIGAGICRGLLDKGCHVAATDLVRENLDDLVSELKETTKDRVAGVILDVTDQDSVSQAFDKVIHEWGGVDIIVANAGVAMVASLVEMDLDAFRRLEKVNVEGTLLTIAEAGRCLCRQDTGGDIIVISSKNVFAPGVQFGAYSATKAGSHQLARIAALELAPFGIRVNMVSPDAVFSDGKRKSGLWAEIGPSRMRARGLDEKGLEEYYRNRNLLKSRVTPAHVANAVLFFATRQTPTTGATIPVDGGLPDAVPR